MYIIHTITLKTHFCAHVTFPSWTPKFVENSFGLKVAQEKKHRQNKNCIPSRKFFIWKHNSGYVSN